MYKIVMYVSFVVNSYHHFLDASRDFTTLNETLNFNTTQKRHCITILVNDDERVEQQESFWVTLERGPSLNNRISITHDRGEIIIPNNDGEICGIYNDSVQLIKGHSDVIFEDMLILVIF